MRKRILITSTDLMMIQFLVPHVLNFAEHGYAVEIACSDVGGYVAGIQKRLENHVKAVYTVPLVRSPFSFSNIKGYRQLKKIIDKGAYDIIWTNEPVMGVATRLAARNARKKGTQIAYMVHGFHFYKGAPLFNWAVIYTIEKLLSLITDYIITLNREDFSRASRFPS
ncbi:MAG: glycosyltransferase [Lacrimispora saccharolytica]